MCNVCGWVFRTQLNYTIFALGLNLIIVVLVSIFYTNRTNIYLDILRITFNTSFSSSSLSSLYNCFIFYVLFVVVLCLCICVCNDLLTY